MSLLKKLQTIAAIAKFMINRYAPYRGAGIKIERMDLENYHIRVKMPLTRKNQNGLEYILAAADTAWWIRFLCFY